MPDKKLTDSEIFETEIKCINRRASGQCNGGADCCKCDLLMNEKDIISAYERAIANIDLINRLQAENEKLILNLTSLQNDLTDLQAEVERLKEENKILKRDNHFNESGLFNLLYGALVFTKTFEDYNKFRRDFKAEAYKEFAERVKLEFYYEFDELIPSIMADRIDNLLKELVGDNNAIRRKG